MKPEVFGGKKKKNPLLRYNDFVWDSVVGMPARGAKNIGKLAIGTVKKGAKIGYNLTDKAIGKKSFKYKSKTKPKTESKPKTETKTKNKNRNKLNVSFGDAVKASGGKRLVKGDMKTKVPASRDFSKKAAEGKTTSFKKGMEANKDGKATKSDIKKSTVFTKHYKTGKTLGVMTRAQRRKYDAEAAAAGGKSFEERVAAHEKSSGHGKKHKRETLYKASQRKKSTPESKPSLQKKSTPESKPKKESTPINKDKKKKKKRELFEGLSTKFS